MIDAVLAVFRGVAEAMLVLRGWSLTTALVIFGSFTLTLSVFFLSAIGVQMAIVVGLIFAFVLVASVFLMRRSAKKRLVENMARRESIKPAAYRREY